jgi:hypothetical protein
MKDRKFTTIALAFAFSLSSTFALANMVRHKPNVRTYYLHRGIPLVRSRSLHPNYNPDGPTSVSAGGYMWNGRSASEWAAASSVLELGLKGTYRREMNLAFRPSLLTLLPSSPPTSSSFGISVRSPFDYVKI